jgi:hypothetical protein
MNMKLRKYISCLLLLVFSYSSLPHSLFHKLFAGHTDTVENFCDYYHKDIGTHVENEQTHCYVFNAQTPLYDAVTVTNSVTAFRTIISVYQTPKISPYIIETNLRVSSRGPPTC